MMDAYLCSTTTSRDQAQLEARVASLYAALAPHAPLRGGAAAADAPELLALNRAAHVAYLHGSLGQLPAGFVSLDASRAWIVYWVTHSLALLEAPLPAAPPREAVVEFLASCQAPSGGFGGGPHQLPHLATTYAAVAALVTIGGADALRVPRRADLARFVLRMCVPPAAGGGMTMHEGGEVDVRGCYCALAALRLLGMPRAAAAAAAACGLRGFVAACASHEGGLGGEPGNEAHGGYSFCGWAALRLAEQAAEECGGGAGGGEEKTAAVAARRRAAAALAGWAARQQGGVEGGFAGRTCKLVDGCYSFWQGGVFPLLHDCLGGSEEEEEEEAPRDEPLDAELAAAAARLRAQLAPGGPVEALVAALRSPPAPAAAAAAIEAELRARLDAAVGASVEAEDGAAAAAAAGRPDAAAALRGAAGAALRAARGVQDALDAAAPAAAAAAVAAPALLRGGGGQLEEPESADHQQPEQPHLLYDADALQLWLLAACQAPRGGLRDKPGKPADAYHTCYCLSGLAAAQRAAAPAPPLGGPGAALAAADPVVNVVEGRLAEALDFYAAEGEEEGGGEEELGGEAW